jgi:hypothetical protein
MVSLHSYHSLFLSATGNWSLVFILVFYIPLVSPDKTCPRKHEQTVYFPDRVMIMLGLICVYMCCMCTSGALGGQGKQIGFLYP